MASLSLEDLDVGPLRGVIRAEQLPVSRAVGKGGRSRANLVADIKVARDRQGGMKRVLVEQAQPASTPLGRAARTPAALKFPEWRREETRKTPDGDMRIAKITMEKNNKACKLVLLAKMFPGRTLIVETAMPNDVRHSPMPPPTDLKCRHSMSVVLRSMMLVVKSCLLLLSYQCRQS